MNTKNVLSEKIAGEITLSPKPGQTIRKWRSAFDISQTGLASHLNISPSVISDYESGRRESPGIKTVKKIIEAFIEIDESRGGNILHRYDAMVEKRDEWILEMVEYPFSISAQDFVKEINGNILTSKDVDIKRNIKGFTLVDSIKMIQSINSTDYSRLYGWSTERAIIFTGVKYGRSPMIAIRVHPVKPTMVVYHNPGAVDPLAIKLAEKENVPLVITKMNLSDLKRKLLRLGEK